MNNILKLKTKGITKRMKTAISEIEDVKGG